MGIDLIDALKKSGYIEEIKFKGKIFYIHYKMIDEVKQVLEEYELEKSLENKELILEIIDLSNDGLEEEIDFFTKKLENQNIRINSEIFESDE